VGDRAPLVHGRAGTDDTPGHRRVVTRTGDPVKPDLISEIGSIT
jgi:hypothetical protein